MKMNPKDHKDEYRQQANRGFEIPPSGSAIVVNTKLQRQKIGKNGTPRLQIWSRILEVLVADEKEEEAKLREWVGKEIQQSLWWDLSKDGNKVRANCMSIACNNLDDWDSDSDSDLVRVMTGVPYLLKWRRKEEVYQGKKQVSLDVYATEIIGQAKRKTFTDAPDWNKMAGSPETRMQPFKDFNNNGSGEGSSSKKSSAAEQDVDPFGDMPFSDGSGN